MAAAGGSFTGCQVSDRPLAALNERGLLCEVNFLFVLLRWEGSDQQGGAKAGAVGFVDLCVGPRGQWHMAQVLGYQ